MLLKLICSKSMLLNLQARNGAGLISSVSSDVTIIDETPPELGTVLDGAYNTSQFDQDAQVNLRFHNHL